MQAQVLTVDLHKKFDFTLNFLAKSLHYSGNLSMPTSAYKEFIA